MTSSITEPLVSVIICVYNVKRVSYTLEAVESVLKQNYENLEILVVSERNPLLTSYLHRSLPPNVRLLISSKLGLCAARNIGIKNAKGEIIAFLDDDAIAHTTWVSELVKEYEAPIIAGVGGKTIPHWITEKPRWFPNDLNWIIGCESDQYSQDKVKVRNLHGCNMSFRKFIFEKVGFFLENLGSYLGMPLGGEEAEFCIRAQFKLRNSFFIYTPHALVFHTVTPNKGTLRYVVIRSYGEGRGKGILRRCFPLERDFSIEANYLYYLFRHVIPTKMVKVSKNYIEILKIAVIILSAISVFLGFLVSCLEK